MICKLQHNLSVNISGMKYPQKHANFTDISTNLIPFKKDSDIYIVTVKCNTLFTQEKNHSEILNIYSEVYLSTSIHS